MTGDRARTARDAEAIGALSRIDSRIVQNALGIPKNGRVFDLGLELNARIPTTPNSCVLPRLHPHAGDHEQSVPIPIRRGIDLRRLAYRYAY